MEIGEKNDGVADSPTSVLEDEETCNGDAACGVAMEEEDKPRDIAIGNLNEGNGFSKEEVLGLGIMNGDSLLISKAMTEEEEEILKARVKEEEEKAEMGHSEPAHDRNLHFSKLDELLTQTEMYSKFLTEKMDDITFNGSENQPPEDNTESVAKGGRGKKRKPATIQYNTRRAKTAVEAMLTRSKEGTTPEDATLTEEERAGKEQAQLVPLMTGGKLKPYQVKGVKWLISLWQNGLNGILADQMGLGKTIQTLGFLAHLKGKGLDGPFLIVAPLSTLSNWVNEVSRFVPSIAAIIYHGTKKERTVIRQKFMPTKVGPNFPLIVTSYAVALNDSRVLAKYKWMYVVVDEGHRLKNMNCLLLRELKRLQVENKLLLTGTPLQNNLSELWSLLNFLLPDIFSSHQEFESWFNLSGKCNTDYSQEESDEKRRLQVISKLHAILRPFLLRRMKEDVEHMLPRKKEIILYANMTEHQKNIQEHLRNKTFENYLEVKAENVLLKPGMRGMLSNLMIQLRKNCNHPDLLESVYEESSLYPPIEQLVQQCGKFRLLDRLMSLLLARRHKVLIFSQWTKVLDIIEYYFVEKGLPACRIDGSVNLDDRRTQIQEFNDINSNVNIFLLSTRAGGLGINLTAADTCILYDSDWNPQMDLQAMDRCHRIGQTRPVHIYRLATSHSVEGKMLKKAFSKLKLEHVVIGKGNFEQEKVKLNTLEDYELLALLRDEKSEDDKLVQTDISDEDLLRIMDRSDLITSKGDEPVALEKAGAPLPLRGPGWEVVVPAKSGGMLATVNS